MSERVRIDCNLGTIAYFALKKLIDDGVCNSTTGFVGQNPDVNAVPPDVNYYVVKVRKQTLLNAETNTWRGELTVTAHAAEVLDIAMRDPINVIKTRGNGVQAMVNQIVNSLQLYDMTNGSFFFLSQPMRLDRQDDIERDVSSEGHSRKSAGHSGTSWSRCSVVFAFVYGEDPTYFSPQANQVGEFTNGFDGGFY